jgi:hypothetical protein
MCDLVKQETERIDSRFLEPACGDGNFLSEILSRNIVCGNALTLMCVDENGNDTAEPIVFSEWAFITGTQMQRKDYTFDELLNGDDNAKKKKTKKEQLTFFDEPQPDEEGKFLKQYISDYRRVQDNG